MRRRSETLKTNSVCRWTRSRNCRLSCSALEREGRRSRLTARKNAQLLSDSEL